TLVRTATGWRADNTDIDGVIGALKDLGERSDGKHTQRGPRAAVLGSGGTAPAAAVALAALGVTDIAVLARNPERAQPLVALAEPLGVGIRWVELGTPVDVDVAVNTLPVDIAAGYAHTIENVPVLLDAIYDPWPTPLASAVQARGGRVISGLQMLLHQAVAQVEQFTGLPAPK
ncbi:shikimate dehydrogenase, partial [Mycolicibacterium austroafricanum]